MENLYTESLSSPEPESTMYLELLDRVEKCDKKLRKIREKLAKKNKKLKKQKKRLKKLKSSKDKSKHKPAERDFFSAALESLPAALSLADTLMKRNKR